MKIGTYFDDYEFACKCGRHGYDSDGHPILDHVIDKRLVDVLDLSLIHIYSMEFAK